MPTTLKEGNVQITAVVTDGMKEWLDRQADANHFPSRSSYIGAVLAQHKERIEEDGQDGRLTRSDGRRGER